MLYFPQQLDFVSCPWTRKDDMSIPVYIQSIGYTYMCNIYMIDVEFWFIT